MTSPTHRPGLPRPSTVVAELTFKPGAVLAEGTAAAAPSRAADRTFRILRTNQVDPYEAPPPSNEAVMAAPRAMAAAGDNFAGSDRKQAKLSVSSSKLETFS